MFSVSHNITCNNISLAHRVTGEYILYVDSTTDYNNSTCARAWKGLMSSECLI